MTIFFSKSVGNFVDDTIWAKLPDDAVEVSQEDYRAFVEARNDGTKVVLGDESGKPYLADAPPPSPEDLAEILKLLLNPAGFLFEKLNRPHGFSAEII